MFKFNLQPLLLGHAGHVHQARAVGTCDVFGACLYVALYFVEAHLCADGSLLHGEHVTEATAFVRTLRLYHLYALHKLEQVLDLVDKLTQTKLFQKKLMVELFMDLRHILH